MDMEYEKQTARMKKHYDKIRMEQIQKAAATAKQAYQYRLDVQSTAESKKQKEMEKRLIQTRSEHEDRIKEMKNQQEGLLKTNKDLENALEDSKLELVKLKDMAKKAETKQWWQFGM
mmetsp:Transcript_9211/g.21252  ORF Transcript_9211/g.21252 Transcript_9211/m.21252 type:complete len:117 (+) Transcript_9211:474-824(+)